MARASDARELIRPALMRDVPERGRRQGVSEIADLVERTVAGDPAAFQQIVLRYERRVMSLARRLLGTVDDAQEAMQETFLRTYRFIHRLDPQRPIEPWLMRLTVNVCRDLARQRAKRQATFHEISESHREAADPSRGPQSGVLDAERRTFLWQAIETLPPAERTAIILRDLEGYSTSEVAAILKSSESTVRSQISRARLKIRKAIDRMEGKGQ